MVQNAGFDGIWAESEIIAFEPYQIKRTDNKAPTSNPDIRYSLEDEEEISNNLEIKTKKGYTGNTRSSRKTEWHTDLTKTQMKQVLKWLDVAGTPEANRITDTSYWYKGRIDGEDLFVIYSVEDPAGKTILYEVKGDKAKVEKDVLMGIIEVMENDGKPEDVSTILKGGWLRRGDHNQHNRENLGRGQYNQNAGILQGQSQRKPSGAFFNVIRNLFAKQRGIDRQYSLEDLDEAPSKQTKAFLDSTLLDNLTPAERVKMVKEYVKELGGKVFTAYDRNGKAVNVRIAKSNERFKNRAVKNVPVNGDLTSYLGKNETKQKAITLIDELVIAARYSSTEKSKYSHDWLDNYGNNDWDYWTTFVQDKNNTIWEARLNIANTANGEKILYDIVPIIEKSGAVRTSDTSSLDNSISQDTEFVNGTYQYSLDDLDEAPSKQTKAFLDAIDDLRNGKKNAADKLAKYVDSGTISTKDYDSLIERYGAIPEGEKPHREVQVPQKTAKDKKVSQTVRTILEAKATPEEAIPTIEKMVEDGVFSYDVCTDKQAISDAEAYLKEYGWEESLRDWLDSVNKGKVSKQITAMGWALYNNAANTAATATDQTEKNVAVRTSLEILNAMVQHQRSAAQALQATRILKKLAPKTQLYSIQKSASALMKDLTEKYGKKAPNIKIDEKLAEDFLQAETQEERDAIAEEIYKDIGRQMPSTWLDKWNAWRYLAMLGNPRTHIKNVGGNAFFATMQLVF